MRASSAFVLSSIWEGMRWSLPKRWRSARRSSRFDCHRVLASFSTVASAVSSCRIKTSTRWLSTSSSHFTGLVSRPEFCPRCAPSHRSVFGAAGREQIRRGVSRGDRGKGRLGCGRKLLSPSKPDPSRGRDIHRPRRLQRPARRSDNDALEWPQASASHAPHQLNELLAMTWDLQCAMSCMSR